MTNLIGFLEGLEKLAYKILLWVILIPKTIAKITIEPRWAGRYIKNELKDDSQSPFDEYISPIILLLAVALLPTLFINFLPKFGMTVTNPPDGFIEGRVVQVEAEAVFKSYSYTEFTEFIWSIERVQRDDLGVSNAELVYSETHSNFDGTMSFQYADQNKIKDGFAFEFIEPGEYYLSILANKFDEKRRNQPVDSQYAAISVIVPETPEEQVRVARIDTSSLANNNLYGVVLAHQEDENTGVTDIVADELKDEANILLALALMLPPLLFALATKLFTPHAISESTLKESFYVQCYYFSPLSLAIWATYYANYFVTPEIFFYGGQQINQFILFIPLGLAFLWFIFAEINAVMVERETTLGASLFVVLVCILIILYTANFFLSFAGKREVFRISAIWSYPVLTVVLLVGFILARIGKRIRRR